MFHNLKTGILYRNPSPHLKSVHAYFPSVVVMANGEMLASFVLGEGFESVNLHTHRARSTDYGETWAYEGELYRKPENCLVSDFARIARMPDDSIIALISQSDRSAHPDEGLANPATMGFAPTELFTIRSADYGKTWTSPEKIDSPLGNTSLELCAPITPLSGGRCLIPTSTWRDWNGNDHHGHRMVALVSHNNCHTWPEYVDIMVDPEQQHYYWESKIIELPDGGLLAVAWVHNHEKNKDLPNHYALSKDGGNSWTEPESTGLLGQTLTPFLIENNRILCIYRRMDKPGLWASISRLDGTQWINESHYPLWGYGATGLTGSSDNMAHNFNVLKFGAPCITRLPDGSIFTAFWCYEQCVSGIRWFRFTV
ncbi:MAG: exo-alpha-sialidase [Candidatus Latescibacteria bacterium]|nr:exo-alpha-sialidase [Candidatus Latescibacterota bacterium]